MLPGWRLATLRPTGQRKVSPRPNLRILRAYILNLDSATDRYAHMESQFRKTRISPQRVRAVAGDELTFPHPQYAEGLYRWFHGRDTNPREVGCYLSHVAALRAFLESGESHGLICEDDVTFGDDLERVLESALSQRHSWNILRVSGLGRGTPLRVADLGKGYSLCVSLGRLKGCGAYVVDRQAAEVLARKLLPMRLPFDHAFDREWFFGLSAAYVLPLPVSQTGTTFRSSIQAGPNRKRSAWRRALGTYPYQAANEALRWLCRGGQAVRARLCASRPVPAGYLAVNAARSSASEPVFSRK